MYNNTEEGVDMTEEADNASTTSEQQRPKYEKLIPDGRKYVIGRKEKSYRIRISDGDCVILRMIQERQQRKLRRKPTFTELIHTMFGISLDCEYNQHHETIQLLKERISLQARVLRKYREKYGDITRQSTLS